MSLDTLAFCSQKMQLDQCCKKFAILRRIGVRRIGFVRFVERMVQEKGLDFRFYHLAKLTRLSALWLSGRRARSARRPLVAGENFFFGGFFCKNEILLISKILLFSWRILRALKVSFSFFFIVCF